MSTLYVELYTIPHSLNPSPDSVLKSSSCTRSYVSLCVSTCSALGRHVKNSSSGLGNTSHFILKERESLAKTKIKLSDGNNGHTSNGLQNQTDNLIHITLITHTTLVLGRISEDILISHRKCSKMIFEIRQKRNGIVFSFYVDPTTDSVWSWKKIFPSWMMFSQQ